MHDDRPRPALLSVVLVLTAACSASGSTPGRSEAAAPPAAGSGVAVAQGAGLTITQAELEQKMDADSLSDLRQREYELRKSALDDILAERLFAKEAQSQGISLEELRKREVEEKAGPPDPAEVEKLYAQNQRRLAGIPKEQAMATVENAVRSHNRDLRAAAYRRELVQKHGIKILLDPPRREVTIPADAPTLGPKQAPVTIVEFADYQCPYCHSAQGIVDEVLKRYSGKVRFVHRDFPLDSIHPRAAAAARASRCAGAQNKFWDYHRGLLAASTDLSDADLKSRAQALALDPAAFESCLADTAGDARIAASLEDGRKLGVTATPTFFVNGRRMVGARGVPEFVNVIEEELAR